MVQKTNCMVNMCSIQDTFIFAGFKFRSSHSDIDNLATQANCFQKSESDLEDHNPDPHDDEWHYIPDKELEGRNG